MDDDGWTFVAMLGIIVFLAFGPHIHESQCQEENNVADCEWVSVPVVPADG